MSNIIPPMLSSTPPPLDDNNLEDEDDDDFGDYSAADLNYSSELSEPSKPPSWIDSNNQLTNCVNFKDHIQQRSQIITELQNSNALDQEYVSVQELQHDNTSQESVVSLGTDSGLCSVSQNSVETSPIPQPSLQDLSPSHEDSSESDETIVKYLSIDPDRTLNSDLETSIKLTGISQNDEDTSIELDVVNNFNKIDTILDHSEEVVPREALFQISSSDLKTNCDIQKLDPSSLEMKNQIAQDKNELCEFHNTHNMSDESSKSLDKEYESINESIKSSSLPVVFDSTSLNHFKGISLENYQIPEDSTFTKSVDNDKVERLPTDSEGSDDEFSDFAFSSAPSTSLFPAQQCGDAGWANMSTAKFPSVSTSEDFNEDDFDDFATGHPQLKQNQLQLSTRIETMVTSLFPDYGDTDTSVMSSLIKENLPNQSIVETSNVWRNLQDVDTSNALTYSWTNSASNKMLLTSLGIDSRNILFGSKWNASVPRFAANLGINPLQPIQASSPTTVVSMQQERSPPNQPTTTESSAALRTEELVPDAQFDWNSSGLVNPLDCLEEDGKRTTPHVYKTFNNGQRLLGNSSVSAEALKVLKSLPDLSFMHSTTLVFPLRSITQPQH